MKDLRKISLGISPPEKLEGNAIYVDVHYRNGFFFARAYSKDPFNYKKNLEDDSFEKGKTRKISTKPIKITDWGSEWNNFLKYLLKGNRAKISSDHLNKKDKESYQHLVKKL